MKLNLHKQLVFILADYLEHYLKPIVNNSDGSGQQTSLFKYHMKKAKLRQIIYNKLIEDILLQSKNGKTVLRFGVNDLKLKYSLTKIMQIFQVNWNMCNIYMIKNDNFGLFSKRPIFKHCFI